MRTCLVTTWIFFVTAASSVALSASLSCSPGLRVSWVVNDSATASDLARATNCSGGVFDVEWIGHVEFPETIYVNEAVLNITGAGAYAIADGADSKQFLNIVNATVRVSGLRIQNCAAVNSGGAIWAEASVLNFHDTVWSLNAASENGGAVAVYNSSSVSWTGNTTGSYNTAGERGGAVFVYGSSIVSWTGETTWSNNNAAEFGGAVFVWDSSDVSWSGDTTWSNNDAAEYGGAVFVYGSSRVFWTGNSTWSNNNAAEFGGAVVVYNSSDVSWSGDTTWSNNDAGTGGAVFVYGSSRVFWTGNSTWCNNNATDDGGAVSVWYSSDVSWSVETTWSNNNARLGGAVSVHNSSDVSWSGETTWSNNNAADNGGAVNVRHSSDVSWSAETTWSNNTSGLDGGAVYVWYSSDVSWSGETTWCNNTSGLDGGAVCVWDSSDVSWSGETTWSNNSANSSGGAVYVSSSSDVSWSAETTWSNNNAGTGGAVYVSGSSDVSWSTETTWSNNNAGTGGAVSVSHSSNVSWSGETTWSYNTAGINGGAIYALSSTGFMFNSALFEGNTAGVGGAIMLSGMDIGPQFVQTNFTANSSPRGGAFYSISSGTATDDGGNQNYPVAFKDCLFTDNRAGVTGGAIESVGGYDHATNTVFEGNTAGAGGALRLGGSAVLTNCTFVDNAAEHEGPAISNLGVLDVEGSASRFSANVFLCENGMYLDSVVGNRYQTVCDGCPEESGWLGLVEDEDRAPICVVQLEHTRSEGGDTTVETLELDAGYWRTRNASLNVLACYNEDACNGGMTDDPAFCQPGYEGPYCSVCNRGYSMSLAYTCSECVDDRGGITILVVVGVFVLGAAIALYMHLVSGEMEGARRGIIHRFTKRLPLQSIKIVLVVWQIVTQFSSVANVTYPDVYQRFLDRVSILNFDALWIPSAGCIVEVDFHGRLLASTIGPLVVLAFLAITYTEAKRRNCGSEAALQKVCQKHMSMVLLISFLVYSSVSATVFQTFACEGLDDGKEYLRADYRIECDSPEHQAFQVFAGIMILVHPVGIPLFYAYLLYKNRCVLKSEDKVTRETSLHVQPISDLWAPYKPGRFYYEVIECLRRMSLTGVVVFIYPNTAAQVAVTLVIAFSFVVVSERLAPYVSKWDASVSLTGHIIVFMSMYVALLSKVEVSDERAVSQEVFAGILIAAHACMVVVVVVETVVIFCSIRRNKGSVPRDGPRPRIHCKGSKIPSSSSS